MRDFCRGKCCAAAELRGAENRCQGIHRLGYIAVKPGKFSDIPAFREADAKRYNRAVAKLRICQFSFLRFFYVLALPQSYWASIS
jgi:hypothetical protein